MEPDVGQPRYVPFDGRAQSISMGLRPLALEAWLEPDARRDVDLARKRELLATHHDEVVATLPSGDAASRETLALVAADVRAHGLVGDAAEPTAGLHPLDAAGRLVQEDLCVMLRGDDGSYVLAAASVCSPSRWRLADKIGRSLAAIHGPVPDYARIARAADVFFERITVERPVWRTNWTLLDDPTGFQPRSPERDAPLGPDVYLRVERQTLRRLPETQAVLFTIRTYIDPLDALSTAAQADLAATLEHVSADLVAYRGWERLLPAVRARLAGA